MVPKGRLLIIGGKEDRNDTEPEMKKTNHDFTPHEILKHLVQSKDDRIEVITTATSDPEDTQDTYRKTFTEMGYSNFDFLHICDNEKDHEEFHKQRISEAKTIFFTGGDQEKICEVLRGTAINNLLREKYLHEKGFTIAGTSAGAMCMPKYMICEALNGEAILENDIKMEFGLSFIRNCIIDTHFVHRGRFGRLTHAVIMHPEYWGIGLGEDTALLIEEGSHAICKGSGMVLMINAKDIKQTNIDFAEKGCPIYAENLKVHILTDGCSINLDTNEFYGAENKKC